MRELLKKLGQSSTFYTFANSIEAISPLLLAVILTRHLSPFEFGIWTLFVALATFVRPIVSLSMHDALKMRFFEMDVEQRAAFALSATWTTTCSTMLFTAIICVAREPLAMLLNFPPSWLVAVPIVAYLSAGFYFLLAFNQFGGKRKRFLWLHILQTSSSLVLISLLVALGFGWQGVVLGKISGLLITWCAGAYLLAQELPLRRAITRRIEIEQLVKFGLLYLPTGLGMVAIPLTDRLIVTRLLGTAENGLYGVAALFGSAVLVVINGIMHAWMPWLFRSLGSWPEHRKELLVISTVYILGLPAGGWIAYGAADLIAPTLIGPTFTGAFHMIPWAIAGAISVGYFLHNQAFLLYQRAILPMSISSLSCMFLNAVASYYGAVNFGVLGVLGATIAAYLVAALLSALFLLGRRLEGQTPKGRV